MWNEEWSDEERTLVFEEHFLRWADVPALVMKLAANGLHSVPPFLRE